MARQDPELLARATEIVAALRETGLSQKEIAGDVFSPSTLTAFSPEASRGTDSISNVTLAAVIYRGEQVLNGAGGPSPTKNIWPELEEISEDLEDLSRRLFTLSDACAHALVRPGLEDAAKRISAVASSLVYGDK